ALGISSATGGLNLSSPVSSLFGSSSAEAATFDGVVAENANGVLTVQTASSLETVQIDAVARVVDNSGAKLGIGDLMAGVVVTVKGKRLANGKIVAVRVDRLPPAAFKDWCDAHGDQCRQLKE